MTSLAPQSRTAAAKWSPLDRGEGDKSHALRWRSIVERGERNWIVVIGKFRTDCFDLCLKGAVCPDADSRAGPRELSNGKFDVAETSWRRHHEACNSVLQVYLIRRVEDR
jgi:hypothetical protein